MIQKEKQIDNYRKEFASIEAGYEKMRADLKITNFDGSTSKIIGSL